MVAFESAIEPKLNERLLQRLNAKMRASRYMEAILSQSPKPIVLAIDEADRLFAYGAVSEEFFGLIRAWHEKSKENPDWQKLKIILSHSTEPLLAQASLHQSPFHNVGLAMDLKAFSHQEIAHLAKAHNLYLLDEEIAKLTSYLGGHPYLTRKLLYEMSSEAKELLELLKPECFEEHLRRYLIAFEQNSALIDALRAIMQGESPKSEHGYILEATGFISASMHNAHFSSKLYQDFFIAHFKDKS
jgi:hypothetical protein